MSHAFNHRKYVPKDIRQKTQIGIIFELESAYGAYETFIGKLQHGTQFKGAHYYMQGRWETTDGEDKDSEEEHITGNVKLDWDLSTQSKLSLAASYLQTQVDLPQFTEPRARHKKSAIELIAGLQFRLATETDVNIIFSGELAEFTDQNDTLFDMDAYGVDLTLKHLWNPKNTLFFESKNVWDVYRQDRKQIDTRYYHTTTLLNTFTPYNAFAVEAGLQCDYAHTVETSTTEFLLAPVLTTRLRLLQHTNLYATYHPRLLFPDFTDLYIKKLYSTFNPDLGVEKIRHSFESGIQQRFGDDISVNIGLFYREREALIAQVDENGDNLLEYIQPGSAEFMGIKANLQMHFFEQLVQNITYTYTTNQILSWNADEDGAQTSFEERYLPYQPTHQIQASLYWTLPFGLSIDFNGLYLSEQYRASTYRARIGERFFLNVALTQKIADGFQLYLLGRNLTDTNTSDLLPMLNSEEITSSRLFVGGVRFRF